MPAKALLYGELASESRNVGRLFLQYKDTCKSALKRGCALQQWHAKVDNRTAWRKLMHDICESINEQRITNKYQKTVSRKRRKNSTCPST